MEILRMNYEESRPATKALIEFIVLYMIVQTAVFIARGYDDNAVLPITIVFSFILAFWIRKYDRSFVGYLILGILTSPVVAIIVLVIISKRDVKKKNQTTGAEIYNAEVLMKYKQLLDTGAISEEEYEKKKAKLLDI